MTYDDLRYDRSNKPIIEEGEVLVRFHYTVAFDVEAWQASTAIDVAFDIEAVNHSATLGTIGHSMRKSDFDNGERIFSASGSSGFGTGVVETWMLPEAEFAAAFQALMADAKKAEDEDKNFWLGPNNHSGVLSNSYDTETSFRIYSYLPEQVRPNAEPIYMSAELMREHFPFLGN